MRKELCKFIHFAGVGKEFFLLLLLRCPFDFLFSMYHANLLEQSFQAMEEKNEGQLYQVFLMFLIAAALLFLYNGTIWILFASYIVKLHARVRTRLFEKITSLPDQTVSEIAAGEWVTRINSDAEAAVNVLGGTLNLPHAAVAGVDLLLSMIVLGVFNLRMLGLSLCFMIPHLILSLRLLARPMTGLREESQKELGRMTGWLEPAITTAQAVKLYGTDEFLWKKIEESSRKLKADNMKIHRKTAVSNALVPLFGVPGYLAMLFLGSRQIRAGQLEFDGLTKQIQYRGGILRGIMMNINCSMNIKNNMAGVRRVNEVMQL